MRARADRVKRGIIASYLHLTAACRGRPTGGPVHLEVTGGGGGTKDGNAVFRVNYCSCSCCSNHRGLFVLIELWWPLFFQAVCGQTSAALFFLEMRVSNFDDAEKKAYADRRRGQICDQRTLFSELK